MVNSGGNMSDAVKEVDSLKQDRDRFLALAFCAADLLMEVGAGGKVLFAAGASQSLLGVGPETLIGRNFLELVSPDEAEKVARAMSVLAPGARMESLEVRLWAQDGTTTALNVTGYNLPDKADHYYLAFRVGSAPPAMDFDAESERDPESGLLQPEAFARAATEQIRQANSRGETLKFTVLTVPELQELRQRVDPTVAAETMKSFGARIQASSAGGEAAACFDEGAYGFLHRSDVDPDAVTRDAEEMFKAADPDGQGIFVDAGSVDADIDNVAVEDTQRVMLYTVRKICDGDNQAIIGGGLRRQLSALAEETKQRLGWFRGITRKAEFDVAFQPIVDLKTREIHHYEALARFGGDISKSPYETIEFAEGACVVSEFDLVMAMQVLKWLNANKDAKDVMVAVNLSGQSIVNAEFIAALNKLLKRYDAVRDRVIFEVTESARIEDLSLANGFIQALRKEGHEVCLDDFGAGSAALRYLQALEVDTVKIDGQYVRGAFGDTRNRKFLKAVAGLCHDLEVATIAEMVENEECADMLAEANVRYGQGYLFGKPSFDLVDFVKKQRPSASAPPSRSAPPKLDVSAIPDEPPKPKAPPRRRMPAAWTR